MDSVSTGPAIAGAVEDKLLFHTPPPPPPPQPPEKKAKIEGEVEGEGAKEVLLDDNTKNSKCYKMTKEEEDAIEKELDDDWENNPLYKMTKEEEEAWEEDFNPAEIEPHYLDSYVQQLHDTQGFDIDYFKGMGTWNLITPVRHVDVNGEFYREFAQSAIDHHNLNGKDGKLKLVKVLKVNLQSVADPLIFMTFEAEDTVCRERKTYQAQLKLVNSGTEFVIFQEKGSTSKR